MLRHAGFTLIELLVVIAIIAVLAVVVVLTLNPAGLLAASRDSNRLSDMATLNSAIGLSLADNASESLGQANVLYVSIPDPSATSTLGDQCQGLGLPSLPAGWAYQCAASGTFRKTDGTGWVPVNFSQNTFGSPFAQLPADPANATSSGLYYTYVTNGQQFEVASLFESQKYKAQFGLNPLVPGYPEVNGKGSSLSLNPLWNPQGLVGYWPMDEGAGSSTADQSGNGNAGAWSGTPAGTSGYYSAGKVGSFAGAFNGSDDQIITGTSNPNFSSGATASAWVNLQQVGVEAFELFGFSKFTAYAYVAGANVGLNVARFSGGVADNLGTHVSVPTTSYNQWHHVVWLYQSGLTAIYVDGSLAASTNAMTGSIDSAAVIFTINIRKLHKGSVDDVRIYNRALSAAEIQALYNAEK